jgi:hypothetical protein
MAKRSKAYRKQLWDAKVTQAKLKQKQQKQEAKQQCLYIEWCVTDGNEPCYAEYAGLMELMYATTTEPNGGLSGQELIVVSEAALTAVINRPELHPAPPQNSVRCTFSIPYGEGYVSMLKNGQVVHHGSVMVTRPKRGE